MSGIINCARFGRLGLTLRNDSFVLTHLVRYSCLPNSSKVLLFKKSNNIHTSCCNTGALLQKQKALSEHLDSGDNVPSMSVKEKVKETTKTVGYSGIVLGGLGVTAIILYYVFRELFSSDSPNSVYTAALERCIKNPKVADLLGEPIKGFGEETRRGRRTHVSHLLYEKDGVNYLRMKFYLKGSRNQATVNLEMVENKQTGHFDYRYLFVQTEDLARRVVILEDNRASTEPNSAPSTDLGSLPAPLFPIENLK
ncbi:mitochondrial import inner membrane translocase subunit Tim21 [Neocloeon triangulifer]|uniref:mitochondrial import inner membrane translocase subunit Tim21 n=1 Tax=Neocloeon triangulifer TaxID=2078957 RepID=UPI00286F5F28|nr:mitochondrial import inner membrane translocase subunit Tim21 [Neocloeon triangulifer]